MIKILFYDKEKTVLDYSVQYRKIICFSFCLLFKLPAGKASKKLERVFMKHYAPNICLHL